MFIRGTQLLQCNLVADQLWDRLVWMDAASQREYTESHDDAEGQCAEFYTGILCF